MDEKMQGVAARKQTDLTLPVLDQPARPSVADQVFELLQQRILTLDLPPSTKISEADMARRMGVSRQPVREAFQRLARLGFLQIRPQSGTVVSLISEQAIQRARFIRTALEIQTVRTACTMATAEDIEALFELTDQQKQAVDQQDADRFHALDEQFHHAICARVGHGYVWDLIRDYKAHMDRIRRLTLSTSSQQLALAEHILIVDAIRDRDPDAGAEVITRHLARIETLIAQIKAQNHSWFEDQPA